MKPKRKEWIARYLPAHIVCTFTSLLAAGGAHIAFDNAVVTAFIATWGENVGYYGFIIVRDARNDQKKHALQNDGILFHPLVFLKTLRNLILEFGPAEILDSFFIRPVCMYVFPKLLGNLALGILIGKWVADILFYIPTIFMYELRKKHFH